MKDEQMMIVSSAAQDVQRILSDLYTRLNGQHVTPERVAVLLEPYFPLMPESDRLDLCRGMVEGIRLGKRDFATVNSLDDDEREDRIQQTLQDLLTKMPEESRRQYLILLTQILFQDSEEKITGDVSAYLSNLPEKDLMDHVCRLMLLKGEETVGDMARVLMQEGHFENVSGLPGADTYSEEERSLLLSAAVYAGLQTQKRKVVRQVDPVEVGMDIGYQMSVWEKIKDSFRENVLPVLLDVLAVAAVGAAIYFALQVPVVSKAVATIWSMVEAREMASPMRMLLLVGIATAVSELHNLISGRLEPALQEGETSRLRLKAYFESTRNHAQDYLSERSESRAHMEEQAGINGYETEGDVILVQNDRTDAHGTGEHIVEHDADDPVIVRA